MSIHLIWLWDFQVNGPQNNWLHVGLKKSLFNESWNYRGRLNHENSFIGNIWNLSHSLNFNFHKSPNMLRYLNHHHSASNQVAINRSGMLICVIFHLKYDRSTLEHEFYINFKPFPNKEILIKSYFNSCCFLFINSAAFNKFCRIGFLKVLSQVA
jgi:hypothetical protein